MRNGTTQAEVLFFQTLGLVSIILRSIVPPGIFHISSCVLHIGIWLTFAFDLLLIVVPVMLTLVLFSDYAPPLLLYGFLATADAILSVDFDVFPCRFTKTVIFDRSVMVLGTATFIVLLWLMCSDIILEE
ncbi:hypothetical protein LOAG_03678 [Loa loa]|uniref:Uncharacterized protein n=1 Tax=Loa loa TaxID=7209 RepID=A0A1S0U4N1_LOALO|nr:hypothetical protein LOAG_03678 [Loa loa]EFO24802.1 hypothetical protein LOAG_03678 [Loa loa]